MRPRQVKRLATLMLTDGRAFGITRNMALHMTAQAAVDAVYKPCNKYGGATWAPRYGLSDGDWKAIQDEIRTRIDTPEQIARDQEIYDDLDMNDNQIPEELATAEEPKGEADGR